MKRLISALMAVALGASSSSAQTLHERRSSATGSSLSDPWTDRQFGLEVASERVSYVIRCQPAGVQPFAPTAPAGFQVSALTIAVIDHPFSKVAGWNK